MKRITSVVAKSLIAILINSGLFAVSAHAQDSAAITASIPFPFSADGQNIAAGNYKLQLVSDSFELLIRNINTGREQMVLVQPEREGSFESHGRLVFYLCGGHSYLAEVHIAGTNVYSETIQGHGTGNAEANNCSAGSSVTLGSQ